MLIYYAYYNAGYSVTTYVVHRSKIFLCKNPKGTGIHNEKQSLGPNKSSLINIQISKKDKIYLSRKKSESSLLMVLTWLFWKIHIQLEKNKTK